MTSQEMYQHADSILHNCSHDGHKNCEVDLGHGRRLWCCVECWNAHVAARRAARKQQIAEFNASQPQCDRCGKHPYVWQFGPYRLCSRCKNTVNREHWQNLGRTGQAGFAALIAHTPAVNTTGWAMHNRES